MQREENFTLYRFERNGIGPFRLQENDIENAEERVFLTKFKYTYSKNFRYPTSANDDLFCGLYPDKALLTRNYDSLLYGIESNRLDLWFYDELFVLLLKAGFTLFEIKAKVCWKTDTQVLFFEKDIISKKEV